MALKTLDIARIDYEFNGDTWDHSDGSIDYAVATGKQSTSDYPYESRIVFTIKDTPLQNVTLTMKITLKGDCHPYGAKAYFSSDNYTPNQVPNYSGISANNSYYFKGNEKITIPNDWASNWVSSYSNTPIYYTFSVETLSIGTHYLYFYGLDRYSTIDGARGLSNYSLTAEYTNTYTIKYDANGGTGAPSEQTKDHNDNLTLRDGSTLSRNSTSAGSYTVTLNANGGNCSTTSLEATRITSYTPLRWNTDSNGNGTPYDFGGTYSVNESVTLYAQWNSRTTTNSVTLPTPTQTGYIFNGWSTSQTASSGITGSYTPSENDVTLYATWSKQKCTITYTYNPNNNESGPIPSSATYDYGTIITLAQNQLEKSSDYRNYSVTFINSKGFVPASRNGSQLQSYSPNGWDIGASGAEYTITSDVTAYPKWTIEYTEIPITLPNMSNIDRYDFNGWSINGELYNGGQTYTIKEQNNITAIAQWLGWPYYIIYDPGTGTGSPTNPEMTRMGEPCIIKDCPSAFSKEGYTFRGWYPIRQNNPNDNTNQQWLAYKSNGTGSATWASRNANGELPNNYAPTIYNPGAHSTSPMLAKGAYLILRAQWSDNNTTNKNQNIIRYFDSDGTTLLDTKYKTVANSTTAKYTYSPGINPNNLVTPPTKENQTFQSWIPSITWYTDNEPLNLIASYRNNTYTISYNANGGSNPPSSQTKIHGTTLTLTSSKPTPPAATTSTGTITVSYNANGGSNTPSAGTGTYTNTTTKSFSKWNTAANGSGTNYSSGGSYTANSSATLYAQWNSSTNRTANPSIQTASAISRANGSDVTGYTVTFNSNGSSVTAPTAITSKRTPKYAFNKWNTNSGGTGTNYNAATVYTFSANCTLYATWTTSYTNKAITLPAAITRANGSNVTGYTVTFNSNGSTATAPSAITSTRTPKYAFAGWNTKTDGSGTNYSAGASYTPSAAITLYAKWTTNYQNNVITLPSAITRSNSSVTGYTVSFNSNGSSATAPTAITSTKTRKYTFSGWNTKSDGLGSNYAANSSYTPSKAITLYAKWISTDTNNAITLPTLTRDGYKFKGWSTVSTATSGITGSYIPTNNVTLYAIWEVNKLNVIYHAEGGIQILPDDVQEHTYLLWTDTNSPYESHGTYEDYNSTNGYYNATNPTFYLHKEGYHIDTDAAWKIKNNITNSYTIVSDSQSYTPTEMAAHAGEDLTKNDVTIHAYANWDANHTNIYSKYGSETIPTYQQHDIYIYNKEDKKYNQYIAFIYENGKWVAKT